MNIKTKTKKNGTTVYTTSLYLGVDAVTGKKVRTTITARTKREVKLKAQQKLAEFTGNGSTVYKEVKVVYYHELAEMWFESHIHGLKPNTVATLRSMLNRHLLPAFGDKKLDKLTPATIQTTVNQWARLTQSKTTSNQHIEGVFANYGLLHRYNKKILQYAVALEIIPTNPAQNVTVPKPLKLECDRIKHLDNEQVKTFLNYLDSRPKTYKNLYDSTLYHFLLATGCRIGEAIALEWKDIDWTEHTVSITKTINKYREINSPKSQSSIRIISLDQDTMNLLEKYKKAQQIESWQLGRSEKTIFSTFTDNYPIVQVLRYRLQQAGKKAGIGKLGFHVFRHTHASLLLNAGIPYKELQHRLGHSTLAMTMDIYGHISQDNMRATAERFSEALKSI